MEGLQERGGAGGEWTCGGMEGWRERGIVPCLIQERGIEGMYHRGTPDLVKEHVWAIAKKA
jgi:hypothetical protein